MSDRSGDWFEQGLRDLEMAAGAADFGRYEWSCFAAHQAAEKVLKALHLRHGQQVWGHDVGRLLRELPKEVGVPPDLLDRAGGLDILYVPTRYPDSYVEGAPFSHFTRLQSEDAIRHASAIVEFVRNAMAEEGRG